MSSTTAGTTPRAIAELAVPDLATLTDAQVEGRVCVWDRHEEPLTGEMAVDLGERMADVDGTASPMRWFPRGCRRHVGEYSYLALFDHTLEKCEPCKGSKTCDTGKALLRLFLRRGWL
ncbi:hypothetical protein [Streptomyces cahuitamycinicus]|uniref:Uncharacterized protein n=1 Tax=Streptomyces cahuitamycinicus TaxID=2070367 RepID=A0A2N8TMS9_9ACTN|nr:hypothetical protein [Streptomyces cahuitamycinicus]PNG20317.1 hypothetical protein C1J00_20860 [Streptomyces cahuitamycinicus]